MTFFKKKIPKWSVLLKEEELGCVGSEMKGVKQNFRSRPPLPQTPAHVEPGGQPESMINACQDANSLDSLINSYTG